MAKAPWSYGQEGANAWRPGDVILGVYEVLKKLGEGGSGAVYLTRHRGWNTTLAVKVPKGTPGDPRHSAFSLECQTWINLGWHDHIVSCHHVRGFRGVPFACMDYIEGGALSDWIRDGRLYEGGRDTALRRVLDISIQSGLGLHYAHQNGLIHQDVKPANILMHRDGRARVSDFGLARASASRDSQSIYGEGLTPAYCSPEQSGRRALTLHTDIWSLGVSILEMFTGEIRWVSGVLAAEVLAQNFSSNARVSVPIRLEMPTELYSLLKLCFNERVSERPISMESVVLGLRAISTRIFGSSHALAEADKPNAQRERAFAAAGANNRSVSLIELEQYDEAERILRDSYQQIISDAGLQYSTVMQNIAYNLCLLRQFQGKSLSSGSLVSLIPAGTEPERQAWLIGMLLLKTGRFHEAIEFLTRAIRVRSPHFVDALNARGIALLLTGETRPALLTLQDACALAPARLDIQRNLALAAYYDGQHHRACLLFKQLSVRSVFDAEDTIRHATLLNASGYRAEACVRMREAVDLDNTSSMVILTAAELSAGAQSFLPGIVPLRVDMSRLHEQVWETAILERNNLRARVDADTLPARFGLDMGATIRNRKRLFNQQARASRVAGLLASSFSPLTKRFRWGELSRRRERIMASGLTAWPALIGSLLLAWVIKGSAGGEAVWLHFGMIFFGAMLLNLRGGASNHIFSDMLRLLPLSVIPVFVARMPDGQRLLDYVGFNVSYLVLAIGVVYLQWQIFLQRTTCRMRGRPNAGIMELIFAFFLDFSEEVTARLTSPSVRDDRTLFSRFSAGVARIGYSIGPKLVRGFRTARDNFFGWQIFLLPQVAGLSYLFFVRTPLISFETYAPILAMPLFLVLFSPWLMLLLNTPGAAVIGLFSGEHVAPLVRNLWVDILGQPPELGGLDVGTVTGLSVAAFFSYLNWLAIRRCPDFVAEWRECDPTAWDIGQVVDPLSIRRFASPWQLIHPGLEQRFDRKDPMP